MIASAQDGAIRVWSLATMQTLAILGRGVARAALRAAAAAKAPGDSALRVTRHGDDDARLLPRRRPRATLDVRRRAVGVFARRVGVGRGRARVASTTAPST